MNCASSYARLAAASEGAMLVFLYSISEAAEGYTEEKTRSAMVYSPDGTRRPQWLIRPVKPNKPAFKLPEAVRK